MGNQRVRLNVVSTVLDELRLVQAELMETSSPGLFDMQRYKAVSPSQAIMYLILEHNESRAGAWKKWETMMRTGEI